MLSLSLEGMGDSTAWMLKMASHLSESLEGVWIRDHFWAAYRIVAGLPGACPTGFVTTTVAAVVMMPVIIYVVLCMVWSLAEVGPARKTMTSFFVFLLGVPLYPALVAVLFAIFWFILGILSLTLVTLGPVFVVAFGWWQLIELKRNFVEDQQRIQVRTQDITFVQLGLGLLMGVVCLCTVGLCTFLSTIVKAPILILSGFCRAWWHAGRAWLEFVKCSWCYQARPRQQQDSDSESDEESGSCFWWYWFPLIVIAWLIFIGVAVCVAALTVIVSALVKLIASAVWPAYVTSGWLRFFGGGTRRRDNSCGLALVNGFKAGYQVLWVSDVLTNTLIMGRFELLSKAIEQFIELAKGGRQELDADCRRLSCLPPVVVGLFQSSWDLATRAIAEKLGIGKDDVEEAWRSLARQMIVIGREAVNAGLLTKDWVAEIPVELVIGLPARAMLDTLERSPKEGQIVLGSGLVLRSDQRPMGLFFNKIWALLMEAQAAQAAAQLSGAARDGLCAILLAGGGDIDELPPGLRAMVQNFEMLPASTKELCLAVQRPLNAISVECSRQAAFKEKLELTIQGITDDDGMFNFEFASLNDDATDSSTDSEGEMA